MRSALLIILLAFFTSLNAQTIDSNYVDGQLYVKTRDTSVDLANYNFTDPKLNKILLDFQVDSMWRCFKSTDTTLWKIFRMRCGGNWGNMDSLILRLDSLNFIQYAERIPLYRVSFLPNDFNVAQQWYLAKVNALSAWDKPKGSASIKIAIVDDGVKSAHEDLAANIHVNTADPVNGFDDDFNGYTDDNRGYDLADDDNDPDPPSKANNSIFSHGTHCAGIASAVTDNNKGIASLGYNVKIIPVKVAPDNTDGRGLTHAYEGIEYATVAGADVISMSFGGIGSSFTGELIIQRALALGIVLVAAAGNEDTSAVMFPAAYNGVIGVGASDKTDNRASFSNYGTAIDVMAPGVDMRSSLATTTTSYGNYSGTSMACPLVAGLAALVLTKDATFTPSQVESFIEQGCENIDLLNPGFAGMLGAGRINAANTMNIVYGSVSVPETDPLEGFVIYPNPTSGIFTIKARTGSELSNVKIYSAGGMLVMESEDMRDVTGATITLSAFAQGFYFVQCTDLSGKQFFVRIAVH